MSAYEYEKVMDFVDEEDVKFIRLAFFDVFGIQKNISIMPGQLERAFREGFLLMHQRWKVLEMK